MQKLRFASALALLALTAAPVLAQTMDALAPARHGELQCYTPNTQAKTCGALAGYTFGAHGDITNTGDVAIYPNPVIVVHMTNRVEVRNGAVCGPMRQEDIDHATFTIDGQPATEEQNASMRTQFAQAAASMINVDVCTSYTPAPDGTLRAEATVDGTAHPEMAQTVIWVHPGDGYTVAPGAN